MTCKACQKKFRHYMNLLDHFEIQAEYYRMRMAAGLKVTPLLAEHVELDYAKSDVSDQIRDEFFALRPTVPRDGPRRSRLPIAEGFRMLDPHE